MLPKILKLCLQIEAEAKININLDKLRRIVEVIEEGILVNIWWKKSSAEDKSKKIKAQGAMLKRFEGKFIANFRHTNENIQVRDKTLNWPGAVRKG